MYTRNVSSLAGSPSVAFRLRFKTDTNTTAAGIAVDDFEVTGPANFWNGRVSNVWSNAANWDSNLVPGINSSVIIPSVAPNFPVVFSTTEIKSIVLKPGSYLTLNNGQVLKINGQ
ncbi:MAG: hypothetical protein IPO92_06650 [Saprospiraceae bacterium]|nr:hypothetical protein [Saprospiraceae bacterium]